MARRCRDGSRWRWARASSSIPRGYVVTNNHVVDGSEKVTVVFQDGTRHPAKIVGRDPKTDLALLKISVDHPLPYVAWGNSGDEQVGDWVVAVGNPFGLGGTVSAGIVSARGRDIHSGPYDNFLQIDAPINRGNSGGPTFNLKGEVIGINTAIYSPNGGSVGIGFAIPSDLAKPVIAQLREHGKVSRGWLGVQIQEVTPAIAKSMGLANDHGALVADVTKGSPAEKAGFKQGDVIESFNGHAIEKLRDLPIMVAETPVGTATKVEVRREGKDITLDTTIAEQPANLGAARGSRHLPFRRRRRPGAGAAHQRRARALPRAGGRQGRDRALDLGCEPLQRGRSAAGRRHRRHQSAAGDISVGGRGQAPHGDEGAGQAGAAAAQSARHE